MDHSSDNGELPAKIEGLPVAGYRAQSSEAIAAVNASKGYEEQVLRLLDEMAADRDLAVDGRWLAIGRSHIEQGFMAVNRSIFKPERIEVSNAQPLAPYWVLEREDSNPARPLYYAPSAHGEQWSTYRSKAMRFARPQDADQMAAALAFQTRVADAKGVVA